jgi:hypothetical protein
MGVSQGQIFHLARCRTTRLDGGQRHRHGLQDTIANCCLCDQEPESVDHLVIGCSLTKQINLPIQQAGLLYWWLLLRKNHDELKQCGIGSTVVLIL